MDQAYCIVCNESDPAKDLSEIKTAAMECLVKSNKIFLTINTGKCKN